MTGDSDGNVMVWKGIKVVRVLKGAHQVSLKIKLTHCYKMIALSHQLRRDLSLHFFGVCLLSNGNCRFFKLWVVCLNFHDGLSMIGP